MQDPETPTNLESARIKSRTRSDTSGGRDGRNFEIAAHAILDGEATRILTSVEAIKTSPEPEGPHQLRVGLRRWRTAVGALKLARISSDLRELANVARGLGQRAGDVRDLDVIAAKYVEPAARSDPDDAGLRSLLAALQTRQAAARTALLADLEQEAAHWFLRIVQQGFGERKLPASPDGMAPDFVSVAIQALERRWRASCKLALGINGLGAKDLHEFRKSIKKLRYLVEFTEPYLLSERQTKFFACLKELQETLGDMNDAEVAKTVLASIGPPGMMSGQHHGAARKIVQDDLGRAQDLRLRAEVLWQRLLAGRPNWHR